MIGPVGYVLETLNENKQLKITSINKDGVSYKYNDEQYGEMNQNVLTRFDTEISNINKNENYKKELFQAIGINFKLFYIDSGFCRVVYKTIFNDRPLIYCIQQEYQSSVQCYRCSNDGEYYEPEVPAKFILPVSFELVPNPDNDSLLNMVNDFIKENYYV